MSIIKGDRQYKILEWSEREACENWIMLIKNGGNLMQKITLNNGKIIYISPESFYEAAMKKFNEYKKDRYQTRIRAVNVEGENE